MMKIERTTNGGAGYSYQGILSAQELSNLCHSVLYKRWEANEFMSRAILDGMVDDIKPPYEWPANPFVVTVPAMHETDPRAMECIENLHQTPRVFYAKDFDQLERTPEIIDSQINFKTWQTFGPGANTPDFDLKAFEIARFVVPKNRVGIVRNIQTGIGFQALEPNSNDLLRWPRGDALYHQRPLAASDYGLFRCHWMLRTETLNSENGNPKSYRVVDPYNGCGNLGIPGLPFNKLPWWQEMLFMWGSDHPQFWIIPENTILSLWLGNPNGYESNVIHASGLLQGYTQPQGSTITFENLTKAW
jgi:hypothetical protein